MQLVVAGALELLACVPVDAARDEVWNPRLLEFPGRCRKSWVSRGSRQTAASATPMMLLDQSPGLNARSSGP